MKRIVCICMILCLALGGCSGLLEGSYAWTAPHQAQEIQTNPDNVHAANYLELIAALGNLAVNGIETGIIYVPQYNTARFEADMDSAIVHVLNTNPIAAYAVDEIHWELGSNSGQRAVSVSISYLHDRTEIRKIKHVANVEEAETALCSALDSTSPSLVLYLNEFTPTDFLSIAERHAFEHPESVMEMPQVNVNVYPQQGVARVVELKFQYSTNRETLRTMHSQVSSILSAAQSYVSQTAQQQQKLTQLYSFLMEHFDYKIETSMTPAYSLLCHGVGDPKAFATVYAAMCRDAGLECKVVTGTYQGQHWYWNLVQLDGAYYHVDLLNSSQFGYLMLQLDEYMTGYVWDYSAYPATPTAPKETPILILP